MTIEEAKEIAITETEGYWEIGDTFENRIYYFVCFKGKGEMCVGVPIIKINKKTKKIQFILDYMMPNNLIKIA